MSQSRRRDSEEISDSGLYSCVIYLFLRYPEAYLTSLWILASKEGLPMSLKISTNSLITLERYAHRFNKIPEVSDLVTLFFQREIKTLGTIQSEFGECCSTQFLEEEARNY